jgi:hypothetical protein
MKATDKPQISRKWWTSEKPSDVKGAELEKSLQNAEKALTDASRTSDAKAITAALAALEALRVAVDKTIKKELDKIKHKDPITVLEKFEILIRSESDRLRKLLEKAEKNGAQQDDEEENENKLFDKEYLFKMMKLLKSTGKELRFGFGLNTQAPENSTLLLARKGQPERLFKMLKKSGDFSNRLITYGLAKPDPQNVKVLIFQLTESAGEPPQILKLGRRFLRSDNNLKFRKLKLVQPGGQTFEDTELDTEDEAAPFGAHVASPVDKSGVDGVLQADSRADGADPWEGLSDDTWHIVDELWTKSEEVKKGLLHSQQASASPTRSKWLEELSNIQVRINALNADAKVPAVKQEYENFVNKINAAVVRDLDIWEKLDASYQDEYGHLSSKKETDLQEAAKALKDRYDDVKQRLDRGAIDYITSDDYLWLKEMLDSKYYIDLGILRGSRNRWKKYQDMLRVVEELKRDGQDADKYVPGWSKRTQEEIDHLQKLINAKITRGGDDYSREFKKIRDDLVTRFDDAKRARKPEKSTLEKGIDFVAGGIEAVVGPIIEAAKQVVDLVQICMHFASLGNYEPKFTSDMAEAAKKGATTGDLLKGMVTGLIETPERLYKAIEAGDWNAIGRETVNIYMLAKSVREVPNIARSAPAIVARTARAIRILKARKLALELHEGKILPQAAPRAPTQPVPGPELYKAAKSPPKGEPKILKDSPAPDVKAKKPAARDLPAENQGKGSPKNRRDKKPAKADSTAEARSRKKVSATGDKPGGKGSPKKRGGKPSEGASRKQSTADERMARMEKAAKERQALEARRKELQSKAENQAKNKEPKEKTKTEVKAERKAQQLAQKENLQKKLEDNRELQLQIYSEIERANQSLKRPMSDKARRQLEARKSKLVIEARRNIEARNAHEASIAELEITPYDRARAYSYSDAAAQSIAKRAAGLDEMSRKPIREPSIDHIVPVEDIVNLRGYDRLFANEQRALLNNQHNLVLMEKGANSSKGSKSWAKWPEGRRIYGDVVAERMIVLEGNLRKQLQGMIIQMLSERGVKV